MVSLSASAKAKAADYFKDLGFPVSAAEIEKIMQGELVRVSIDTLTERELATAFGVVIPRSPEQVERIFLENLGKEDSDDSIQQIVNSGAVDNDDDKTLDFSSIQLLPVKSAQAMVTQYVNPKSSADLNLSAEESALFHALNPKSASVQDVEQILRKVLANRLQEYQQKGLEGIAPYQRGKSAVFEPGKELMERCQKLPVLHKQAPEFAKYLMEYPNSKPPTNGQIKESFCVMNFNIDDKPTFSLVHKVSYQRDDVFFVFHRHFYVSRGHNSVQAVGGGKGIGGSDGDDASTILVFSSRTSTDQVAGFGGSAKRIIGSRIMGEKLTRNLSVWLEDIKKNAK